MYALTLTSEAGLLISERMRPSVASYEPSVTATSGTIKGGRKGYFELYPNDGGYLKMRQAQDVDGKLLVVYNAKEIFARHPGCGLQHSCRCTHFRSAD